MLYETLVPEPEVVYGREQAVELLEEIQNTTAIAVDTETTGLVRHKDNVVFWSMSDGDRRWCLDRASLLVFKPFLEDPKRQLIFQNANYDAWMLLNSGIDLARHGRKHYRRWDTAVMHCLWADNQFHDLKSMSKKLLRINMPSFRTVFNSPEKDTGKKLLQCWAETPEKVVEYASLDAWATYKLWELFLWKLDEMHTTPGCTMLDYYRDYEQPMHEVLWHMERKGALIDMDHLEKSIPTVEKEIYAVSKEINKLSGRVLNVSSPKQLVNLFFEKGEDGKWVDKESGEPPDKMTSGGISGKKSPSVDKEVLEARKFNGCEISSLILEYRTLSKLCDTYMIGIARRCDKNGRLHTSFNQHSTSTGRLSSSDPNCFDATTEVLTRGRGWVPFPELEEGEWVAQWDQGVIEFVQPTGHIKKKAKELVHINLTQINLAVTPEHRCLLRHRKTGELCVFQAQDYPEDWKQINAGEYGGGSGLPMEDAFLRLALATQADGHWHDGGITFTFSKKRKISRLQSILEELEVPYSLRQKYNGTWRFRVMAGPVVHRTYDLLGQQKLFGPWILNLSRDQLDVFVDEIFFWGGCWTRRNHYASKHQVNSSWVQTVLALSGMRSRTRVYTSAGGSVSHQTDVTLKDYCLTTNRTIQTLPHNEDVYCVSVPSSYLIVRRGQCIMVTGNCQNLPRTENDKFGIRRMFISPPGYLLGCSDYAQLEMRIVASIAEEETMMTAIRDGLDQHSWTAHRMFGVPYEKVKEAKDRKDAHQDLTDREVELCKLRFAAKTLGFAVLYGAGPFRLSTQLECSIDDAKDKLAAFFNGYPAIRSLQNEIEEDGVKYGYVVTQLGRRRILTQLHSPSKQVYREGVRAAVNMPIQGHAAELVKGAQIRIFEDDNMWDAGVRQILQVHDEILAEVPSGIAKDQEFKDTWRHYMAYPFGDDEQPLLVPLSADIGFADNWADAK